MALSVISSLDYLRDSFSTLAISIFTLFLIVVTYWNRKPRNFPAGPSGVPLLGVIPFLGRRPEKKLMKWAKKYGDVTGLAMGQNQTVVLNTYAAVQEVFVRQGKYFSYRPRNFLFDKIGRRSGISMNDFTDSARQQKNFILNSLRKFGFGRKSMESSIVNEAKFLIGCIQDCKDDYNKCSDSILNAVSNVICHLTLGRRFEYDDETGFVYVARLLSRMNEEECLTIQAVLLLPFLRHLPPFSAGIVRLGHTYDQVHVITQKVINEHKATLDPQSTRDIVDDFLVEMMKIEENGGSQNSLYTEWMLNGLVRDFFVAGTETTQTSLKWMFLILANRPHVQEKLFTEIVEVVGQDGIPTMKDREHMPYTQAVIQEVLRYRPPVPMALPHTASEQTTIYGYDIPEGTTVMANLYSCNHDPTAFSEPEKFVVERHLDKGGNYVEDSRVLSFSAGPRYCIGYNLARMELFLISVTVLQAFKTVPLNPHPEDESLNFKYSEDPEISGLVLSPDRNHFKFEER